MRHRRLFVMTRLDGMGIKLSAVGGTIFTAASFSGLARESLAARIRLITNELRADTDARVKPEHDVSG